MQHTFHDDTSPNQIIYRRIKFQHSKGYIGQTHRHCHTDGERLKAFTIMDSTWVLLFPTLE